ncbi:MAG: FadR/GntR family transcriptional regulator [Acidimicrobiia bacterium]|nr:MAG: FadR/GntR family transcriptional regulator [Acidimicrobiia bacterium]
MAKSDQLPDLAPPAREDTSLAVARNLLNYVLTSDLQRGDRLPSERELARAAGVSRSVMREALKALGFLGLIEVRPGDGTYLANTESALLPKVIEWSLLLGEKPTHDVLEARTYVEVAVARIAAVRRQDGHIDELREQLEAMRKAATDRAAFSDADVSFHLTLARASGNVVFGDILNSMHALLLVWSKKTIEDSEDLASYYEEHLAVFEAVEARDADAAATAMSDHMSRALERIEAITDSKHGEAS